jgi:riboflavin biosynthesis pyrimidine reductase
LCEGGGELNAAMFQADLVDEIHLTISPKIFGGRHTPTIAEGEGWPGLRWAKQFELSSLQPKGQQLFTVFSRKK